MPTRPDKNMLTAAESEVMNVFWAHGPAVVAEIVPRLSRTLAYTTVMTTVRIMEEKGFVRKQGKRGRAYVYEAVLDREDARESMAREIARRLFGGSVKSLVLNLVRDETISPEDLAEVKRMIEQIEADE